MPFYQENFATSYRSRQTTTSFRLYFSAEDILDSDPGLIIKRPSVIKFDFDMKDFFRYLFLPRYYWRFVKKFRSSIEAEMRKFVYDNLMLIQLPLNQKFLDGTRVPFVRHEGDPERYGSWLGINLNVDLLYPTFFSAEKKFSVLASRGEAV